MNAFSAHSVIKDILEKCKNQTSVMIQLEMVVFKSAVNTTGHKREQEILGTIRVFLGDF